MQNAKTATQTTCSRCDEMLDYPEERAANQCFLCQIDPVASKDEIFVVAAKSWIEGIIQKLGGTSGRDQIGDPSPWQENAVRSLEDCL